MSKKILILSSTPRKGGNSDVLCDQFALGTQEVGHTVEKIFLKDKKINYCTGCGTCYNVGKPCPQKDDMAQVLDKMLKADVIVMATPVYFYSMSAQLKTLIDRCCSRYTEISNKEFYFILTAAESNVALMQPTIDGFRAFTSCLNNPIEKGVIYGVGAWQLGEINNTNTFYQAFEMGKGA